MSDTVRLQFGGMWHDYKGSQNAGWNRLTQDLIDNGTYITGTPIPLDTSGDGFISHDEYYAGNINPFALYAFFGQKDIDLATLSDASLASTMKTQTWACKMLAPRPCRCMQR